MNARPVARWFHATVAAMMILTVLPSALFVGPVGAVTVLPPSSSSLLGPVDAPVAVDEGISGGMLAPVSPVPTPWIAKEAPQTVAPGPSATSTYAGPEALVRAHLLKIVGDPKDLKLGVLEFLEKYPALKAQFARMTGIDALAAEHYDFTAQERALLYGTMRANAVHTSGPGVLIPHDQLVAAGGPVPLTHTSTLVIDDDGSPNNNGPDVSLLPWTWENQTAQVTAALDNNSIAYDLFVRPFGGAMPDFMTLTAYDRIIYVSGQSFVGMGAVARFRLAAFAEAEGDIWFIGQFSPYRFYQFLEVDNGSAGYPDFLTTYMGIASFVDFGTANVMSGTASSFLSGQSYSMSRYLPDNSNSGLPVDYAFHLNYTATAQELTTGPSVDWQGTHHTNVVNNVRNSPAGKGVVITSAFEYSYIDTPSDRDNFTLRVYNNLSATPGLAYDSNADAGISDIVFTQRITGWDNASWPGVDDNDVIVFYFYIFGAFIEAGTEAQVVVTVENYRNAAFATDLRIQLQGDQVYNPISRIENSTRIASLTVPARGTATSTLTFTPHRIWIQDLYAAVSQATADAAAFNNELYLPGIGVAGYFDGAETARAETVADGFQRVNDPALAPDGSFTWFTGTGANLDNTLTFPWIDLRYLNGTGPGERSIYFLNDALWFYFAIRGDATAPDGLDLEYRNESDMTWTSVGTINGPTGSPIGWTDLNATYYQFTTQTGVNIYAKTWGVPAPEFQDDQFLQLRLRYHTGINGAQSLGYSLDSIGWMTWQELNAPVDFQPLVVNAIPTPPQYTVWQGATPIRAGPVSGTIDINESETVTIDAYVDDPQGDFVSYAWSQSISGAAALPAPANTSSGFAHTTWTFSSDINTYERFRSLAGTNVVTFTLTATDELLLANATAWSIRVHDAAPAWSSSVPTNFGIDEDSTSYLPATGVNAWFTDPQGDPLTLSAISPIVNGSPTVTLLDLRSSNGSIGLRASSPDWCGATNLTVTATDNKSSSVQQVLDVTVNCVNDAPRLGAGEIDQLNATAGEQRKFIRFNVTLFDVDDVQATLAVSVVSNPANKWTEGRNATGNLQMTAQLPDNEMVGYNWFNVTICDPQNACTVAEFHVFIANVNDPPVMVSTGQTRYADQGVQFSEQFFATDPDDQVPGAPRTVFLWTDDSTLFEINSTGWVVFTATNDQVGSWTVTVRVSDGTATASLPLTVIVTNTNDAPVLPPYSDLTVTQDLDYTAPLLKAQDPDLALWNKGVTESLIYTDDCALFNIEVAQQPSPTPGAPPEPVGQIKIHATNAQVGEWTCTVTVTDAGGLSDTLEIHVTVNNVNDSPTDVRINITSDGADERQVTVSDTRVEYKQDQHLVMKVFAGDPDIALRQNDPTRQVNPSEALTCSIFSQFTGSLDVPQSNPEKPTITSSYDPVDGCVIDFTPTNTEVGLFTITVTVRDAAQTSVNFKIKLQVDNVNDGPTNVRVVAPAEGFTLESTATLTLSGSAADMDTADSGLTYSWVVEVVGGGRYTSSAKSAQIQLSNADTGAKQVRVTFKVTDNLEISNPIDVTVRVNGTINGKPSTPGFELPAVVTGLALVAAAAVVARRRRDA